MSAVVGQQILISTTPFSGLLEDQASRNGAIEKKQRKLESDINAMNDINRQEAAAKEKAVKDCEHMRNTKKQLEEHIEVGGHSSRIAHKNGLYFSNGLICHLLSQSIIMIATMLLSILLALVSRGFVED